MQKILFIIVFFSHYVCAGSVVLLNGTSSVGKTSIAHELVQIIPNSIVLSLDDLYWNNMFQAATDMHLINEHMSFEQQSLLLSRYKKKIYKYYCSMRSERTCYQLHNQARRLADQGYTVIIDTVLGVRDHGNDIIHFKQTMEGMSVVYVVCYSGLRDLQKRVEHRNRSTIFMNHRKLVAVLSQVTMLYDLACNQENAIDVLDYEDVLLLFDDLYEDECFEKKHKKIKSLYLQYVSQYNFKHCRFAHIVYKYDCDLFVNTGYSSPKQSAYVIANFCTSYY